MNSSEEINHSKISNNSMNNSNKTINNNNTINSKGKRSYSSIALRNQNIVSNLNNISTEELYLIILLLN